MTDVTMKRKVKYFIGLFVIFSFVYFPFATPFHSYLMLPTDITTFSDDDEMSQSSDTTIPASSHLNTDQSLFVYKNDLPIKKVNVTAMDKRYVILGGQSIGIQLQSSGVVVVGHHDIDTVNMLQSPVKNTDIKAGDVITEINDKKIKHVKELQKIITDAGKNNEALHITYQRGAKEFDAKVTPILNDKEKKYQIGLYMKDASSGIGTITFIDEKTGKYGALGHTISDSITKKPIDIHQGKIVPSKVTNIQKGNKGMPGEKQATFSLKGDSLGTVTKNSPFGIYGELNPKLIKDQTLLEVGNAADIEKGPAEIRTVIDGDKIESFEIEVVHSVPQKFPATKGMIIKVTDERLLDATGGIVQGMSGSPIIQNNKIIGAVTHVFVNDPISGYGVHIEWMLNEAGVDTKKKEKAA